MTYKSRYQSLDGYWEKLWNELPDELRQAWADVHPMSGIEGADAANWWGSLAPSQREESAKNFDYKNDPALAGERLIAWHDGSYSIDARYWFSIQNVAPREAAMVLWRLNPLNDKDPELTYVDGDESSPGKYRRLLRAFEDVASAPPKHRTLMEWLTIARERGLRFHSWIEEYAEAVLLAMDTVEYPVAEINKRQKLTQFQPSTVEGASSGTPEKPPAPSIVVQPIVTINLVETRINTLSAVIATAKKSALDPDDAHSHWAAFVKLAQSDKPPSPLIGFADEEGVKYQGELAVEFLTRRNFLRRIRRQSQTKTVKAR